MQTNQRQFIFVKEFITEGWTWNVYVKKKDNLKNGEKAVKAVLSM